MSANDAVLTRQSKTRALLFTFVRGGVPYYFTDYPINIDVLSVKYVSIPEIVVDLPANTGGLNDGKLAITMPLMSMTLAMSNGEPQPLVTFEMREWYISRADGRADVEYLGEVRRAVRGVNGNPAAVRLECINVKSRLGVASGIPATIACAWLFTKRGCGKVVSMSSGFIANMSSALVQITGHSPTGPIEYWRRGYVEYLGLRLLIRDYDGVDLFLLGKQPPLSWLNQTVGLHPGCDRLATTCNAVHANILRFAGIGYAIPDYHPVIETP